MTMLTSPHQDQPVLSGGRPVDQARGVLVLLHGRGASAQDILLLASELDAQEFAWLAPQAAGDTWYPYRFLEPTQKNQPHLDSALAVIGRLLKSLEARGIAGERIVLLGFSQGGCLALEYAARNGRRYGGVIGLSSGLIGADGEPRQDQGNLGGTPVFLGCAEYDDHIPQTRLHFSAARLKELGGAVTLKLYPRLGHAVNQDEIEQVNRILSGIHY
jgi:predicted esterase